MSETPHWYLIHTKPRQEHTALRNLQQQGYVAYLPLLPSETLRRGALAVTWGPLFPRYLFIQLEQGASAKSWAPIRSTKGVSRMVCFGNEPAKVDARLIDFLKTQETALHQEPQRLFTPGTRVQLTHGAFAGIEGIYQMTDGEHRVMVLIEMLSKRVALRVSPAEVRRVE